MWLKMTFLATVFIGITVNGIAISETREECQTRLQNSLLTCYSACNSSDDVGKCQKTCRQRYAKQECN